MATTVVVAFEPCGTGADGNEQRVLQVDVSRLQHIEIAPLHNTDGLDEIHEIFCRTYLIGVFLGAFA